MDPRRAARMPTHPFDVGSSHGSERIHSTSAAIVVLLIGLFVSGCVELKPYRTVVPAIGDMAECAAGSASAAAGSPPCNAQTTERNSQYTMHVVEFDDEGWPFDGAGNKHSQVDSAIRQIKEELVGTKNCVRLFVYVHGWRHNAGTSDPNVVKFRDFLAQVSDASKAASRAGEDACEDPALASVEPSRKPKANQRTVQKPTPSEVKTVGIYVGWRGLSVVDTRPLVYLSFWDRKNTADRVAQGSVRELFGRLHALASYAPAAEKAQTQSRTNAQLRTYVIGHSFGASVVFRALSQSLIDAFAEDLDADATGELASVSRFVDMVVLVNPAIEAARFDPVYRAAMKLRAFCERDSSAKDLCDRPRYQAPVLAIFTSAGDQATRVAFPVGAALSNTFENTLSEAQRQSIVQTIGWDDDYATHILNLVPNCDGANTDPFDSATSPLRYNAPGWAWCFKTQSGSMVLTHLGQPGTSPGQRVIYNGPLWNVRVPISIMSNHNDTWNDKFRDLLLHLFTDERRNPSVY